MKLLTCYLVNDDGSENKIIVDEHSPAWSLLYHEFYQRRIINIQRRWRAKHGRLFQDSKAHSNIPISLNLRLPGLACEHVNILQQTLAHDNPLELYEIINHWPLITGSRHDQLKQCLLTLLVTENTSIEQYTTVSLLADALDWLKQAAPDRPTLCGDYRFFSWDDPDAPFSLKDTLYPNREAAHEQMLRRMTESELSTIESGYYMLQLPKRYFYLLLFILMKKPDEIANTHYDVLHKVFHSYLSKLQAEASDDHKILFDHAKSFLGKHPDDISEELLMSTIAKIGLLLVDRDELDWVYQQLSNPDLAARQNINFLTNMLTYKSFFYTLWQHPEMPHTLSVLLPSSSSQQIAATCLFGESYQQPWYTVGKVSPRFIHHLAYQPTIDLYPKKEPRSDRHILRRPLELVTPLISRSQVVHGFEKIHPFLLSQHDRFHISIANDSLQVLHNLTVHHNQLFRFSGSPYHRRGVHELHMSKPLWALADLDLVGVSTTLNPKLHYDQTIIEARYFCQIAEELNRGRKYQNRSVNLDLLLIDMILNPNQWHAFRDGHDDSFFWRKVKAIDPRCAKIKPRYQEIKDFLDSCGLSAETFWRQDKHSLATILLCSYFNDDNTEILLGLFDDQKLALSKIFYWHRQEGFTLRKPFQLPGWPKSVYQDTDGRPTTTNQFAAISTQLLIRSFVLLYLHQHHDISLTDAAKLIGHYEHMMSHTDDRVVNAILVVDRYYNTILNASDAPDEARVAPLP